MFIYRVTSNLFFRIDCVQSLDLMLDDVTSVVFKSPSIIEIECEADNLIPLIGVMQDQDHAHTWLIENLTSMNVESWGGDPVLQILETPQVVVPEVSEDDAGKVVRETLAGPPVAEEDSNG